MVTSRGCDWSSFPTEHLIMWASAGTRGKWWLAGDRLEQCSNQTLNNLDRWRDTWQAMLVDQSGWQKPTWWQPDGMTKRRRWTDEDDDRWMNLIKITTRWTWRWKRWKTNWWWNSKRWTSRELVENLEISGERWWWTWWCDSDMAVVWW